MCKQSPCFPTPQEVITLLQNGYQDQLSLSIYADSVSGKDHPAITPKWTKDEGCTFQNKDGLCELHDLGLKPLEGRLAHHTLGDSGLRIEVAQTWHNLEGFEVIKHFPEADPLWKAYAMGMVLDFVRAKATQFMQPA